MTEVEYTELSDLVKIRIALHILSDCSGYNAATRVPLVRIVRELNDVKEGIEKRACPLVEQVGVVLPKPSPSKALYLLHMLRTSFQRDDVGLWRELKEEIQQL